VTSVDKRYIWVKQPLARSGATLVTSVDKLYIWVKQPLARSGATLVTSFIDRSHECRSTKG
jgi:hypothetical protein